MSERAAQEMSVEAAALVDLDAYCARIGYHGPRIPSLEVLQALNELHPASIAFENIDVLLGRGVDIAPVAVDAKLINRRRGGYCFEHNSLFKRVLIAMGFEVEALLARVVWMAPQDSPPRPRTHMALRVGVAGRAWLVDVGFGGCVPTAPLALDSTEPQSTQHEAFRIRPQGTGKVLEAYLDEAWAPLYEFTLEPQLDVDYELPNWYTSTHPSSHFLHDLSVARTTPEARYTLSNARLTIRKSRGEPERRLLTADELERTLADTFGLPVESDWQPMLARAVSASRD